MSKPRKMPLRANASKLGDFIIEAAASFDIVEAKAGEAAKRPTFEIVAYNGDKMRPGGYYREVVIDLAGLEANSTIPILLDHDPTQIVGQANEVRIGNKSVTMSGVFTGDHTVAGEPAHKVASHAKNGLNWAASVGVAPGKTESISENQTVTVNGREFKGPILVVRTGRLGETSFVAIGADKTAGAKVAASAKGIPMNEQFEKWLKANELFDGFEALSKKAQAKIKAQYEAEQEPEEGEEEESPAPTPKRKVKAAGSAALRETVERVRAKNKRSNEISEIAAGLIRSRPDMVDEIMAGVERATENNDAPNDFKLTMLEMLGGSPEVGGKSGQIKTLEPHSAIVLEASICKLAKLPNIEKHFKEPVLDAADQAFNNGIGIRRFLEIAAQRNYREDLRCDGQLRRVMEAAFPPKLAMANILRAGWSGLDTAGILSNVANKFAREQFMATEQEWRKIASTASVSDYKQITTYSLTGDLTYEELGAGGEIKHGKLGETSYTNQAKTHAKMLKITEPDIVNDNLKVFQNIGKRLGRGGQNALNKAVWGLFNANSAFFTTGRNNKASGATTALSPDSLEQFMTLFLKQTDPDGLPTGVEPKLLVVPPELWTKAKRLMESESLRELNAASSGTSSAKTYGTANPWANKFQIVMSRFLSSTALGGSTTAWYLLADPNEMPVIEVCFLNGQEYPAVESADADFNELGVQFRGRIDFGVSFQEYRGGVMSAGA